MITKSEEIKNKAGSLRNQTRKLYQNAGKTLPEVDRTPDFAQPVEADFDGEDMSLDDIENAVGAGRMTVDEGVNRLRMQTLPTPRFYTRRKVIAGGGLEQAIARAVE